MNLQRQIIIRRFTLGPLAQWGFITGVLIACLPAFLCSWVGFSLVTALQGMLSNWTEVGFEFLGQKLSFNLIETLNLTNAYATLSGLAAWGVFGILFFALLVALALGVFGALVLTVLGLFYNATGRLQIEVQEVPVQTEGGALSEDALTPLTG